MSLWLGWVVLLVLARLGRSWLTHASVTQLVVWLMIGWSRMYSPKTVWLCIEGLPFIRLAWACSIVGGRALKE